MPFAYHELYSPFLPRTKEKLFFALTKVENIRYDIPQESAYSIYS